MFVCFSAATVASQWLELLQQDIKGRLSGKVYFLIYNPIIRGGT